MKKRLAAFDLDGTLLTGRKTITEQTREAVRRAIESGIQVAFCTGRTRLECVDVIEALPEVRYLVASSGARIWDLHENRVAAEDCFPPEISKALVDRLVRFHVLASVFTADRIAVQPEWRGQYAKHFDDVWAPHFERFYTPVDDYLNYAAGGHGAVEKIFAVFLSHEERDAAWKANEGIPCESGDSAADNLELTPKGVDKGTGLARLAEMLGVARENVAAAGDSCNDLPMLAYAGAAVAMRNADLRLREKAKWIAPSNEENGAAWVLNKMMEGAL